jgi:hypothetical protein
LYWGHIHRIAYQSERQARKQLVQPIIENQLQSKITKWCARHFAVISSVICSYEHSISTRVKVNPGCNGVSNIGVKIIYPTWTCASVIGFQVFKLSHADWIALLTKCRKCW